MKVKPCCLHMIYVYIVFFFFGDTNTFVMILIIYASICMREVAEVCLRLNDRAVKDYVAQMCIRSLNFPASYIFDMGSAFEA